MKTVRAFIDFTGYPVYPGMVKPSLLNYVPYAPLRLMCLRALFAFGPYVPSCLRVLCAFTPCVPWAPYLRALLKCLPYLIYVTHLCTVRVLFTRLKTSLNFLLNTSFKPHIKDNFIERSFNK